MGGGGRDGRGGGKFALTICVFVVDCQMMTKYKSDPLSCPQLNRSKVADKKIRVFCV